MSTSIKLFLNFISFITLVIFYHIVGNNDIFLYVLSFVLYQIIIGLFNHIDIKKQLKEYLELKYYYSKEKIFTLVQKRILLYAFLLALLVIGSSFLVEFFLKEKYIVIALSTMSLTIFINPLLNVIRDYATVHNLKKESTSSILVENITNIIYLIISSFFLYRVFNLPDYLKIIILLLGPSFSGLVTYLYLYKTVLSKKKKLIRTAKKSREEVKVNYQKVVKEIFSSDFLSTLTTVVPKCYLYISVIILYKSLISRYYYLDLTEVKELVVVSCFWIYNLISIIKSVILILIQKSRKNINDLIFHKNYGKIGSSLSKIYKEILARVLPLILTICILAKPLWILFFEDSFGYNILAFMIFEVLFIILYIVTIDIVKELTSRKALLISLLSGFLFKLCLTIPFIDSFYRMGYNLVFGDILCTIISYFISLVISLIYIRKKISLNFLESFKDILNIFYNNIIISLVLILFQFLIPFKNMDRVLALLISVFYAIIAIITYLVISKINKIDLNN